MSTIPGSVDPKALTDRQILWSLIAHFISASSIGLAIGGMVPLIAVSLDYRDVPEVLIGVNSAMTSLGVILVAPFATRIVRSFGVTTSMAAGLMLAAGAILAMAYVESIAIWIVLRFLIGAGVAVHWVIGETWMNAIVTDRRRGLVMALYLTSISAGFVVGPLVLTWVGASGALPFLIFAALTALTGVPMLMLSRLVPVMKLSEKGNVWNFLKEAPTLAFAAIATGLVDAAFFTFMSIYGLRIGYGESEAIQLVSIVFAGNLFLQVPLGWVADRMDRRRLLIILAAIGIVSPGIAAYGLALGAWWAYPVLFIWGGSGFGIYTVAVTMLGQRYSGGEMAAANAAFVMWFELSNLVGPPIAGWSIDKWSPHGLMVFMASVAVGFLAITLFRGLKRSD